MTTRLVKFCLGPPKRVGLALLWVLVLTRKRRHKPVSGVHHGRLPPLDLLLLQKSNNQEQPCKNKHVTHIRVQCGGIRAPQAYL